MRIVVMTRKDGVEEYFDVARDAYDAKLGDHHMLS